MSKESQSEQIWQYAMHSSENTGKDGKDAKSASLHPGNEMSLDEVTTEFSDIFGSIPAKFSYHGLANSQSQNESQWDRAEDSLAQGAQRAEVQNTGLQQEASDPTKPTDAAGTIIPVTSLALHVKKASFNKGPVLSTNEGVIAVDHVTEHVMSASRDVAAPTVKGREDPGVDAVPSVPEKGSAVASHLVRKNKTISFRSPAAPPQPKPVSRVNTMPPRLNRYAPRDIDRSSPDSFAGPSIPRDLNTFVKNSKVFNNTFVRTSKNGGPIEVFEVPSHVSTTPSQDPPSLPEVDISVSQSEVNDNNNPSPSQLVRAAFNSHPSQEGQVREPVVLVKDSQSQSQNGQPGEVDSNDSMVVKYGSAGDDSAIATQSDAHESQERAPTPTPSSSSFVLLSEKAMELQPTQPNSPISTQPGTQPATQPEHEIQALPATQLSSQLSDEFIQNAVMTPSLKLHISTIGSIAASNSSAPSPLPIPSHRLQQIERARLARQEKLARQEVIPETPLSTVPQSVPAASEVVSSNPLLLTGVESGKNHRGHEGRRIQLQRAVDKGVEKGKAKARLPASPGKHSPSKSKGKGKSKQVDVPVETSPSRHTRSATKRDKLGARPHSDGNPQAAAPALPAPPVPGPPGPPGPSTYHHETIIPDSLEKKPRGRQTLEPQSLPAKEGGGGGDTRLSEVVPDSLEEQQAEAMLRSSSPAIPLIEAVSRRQQTSEVRFPTPTPAAVRSSLRRGELPVGVTHTRGSRRSNVKSRGESTAERHNGSGVPEGDPIVSEEEEEEAEAMDVDAAAAVDPVEVEREPVKGSELEAQHGPEIEPAIEPEHRTNPKPPPSSPRRRGQRKASAANSKPNKKPVPGIAKKKGAKNPRRSVKAEASARPITRKRKSEPEKEPSRGSEGSREFAVAPPKKRLRGSTAATPASTSGAGAGPSSLSTRVLARKLTTYFPGTVTVVTSPTSPVPALTSFTVQFDDGSEEVVDVEDMRRFVLELHDHVYIRKRSSTKGKELQYHTAEVLEVDRWKEVELARVHDTDGGFDGDDYDVEGRLIMVPELHIHKHWNERRMSTRTLYRDKGFDQAPPNTALAGFGFIVTLADLPKSKQSLVQVIETSGGVVYSDWSAIVSLTGVVEASGRRMTGKTPEMRVFKESRKTVPMSLFCLTDEPRTTPKYLLALALGVPCLSMDWVLDRVLQHGPASCVDWQAYILPAGQNPVTRLAASQAFDRKWWRLDENNLPNLLSDPPVNKIFADKAFLCIGPDFILPEKREFGTFPKLILAMGAEYVQAVVDISRVSTPKAGAAQRKFDYTVVDDGEELIPYQEAATVNVSWIKKCLITGVEGPTPWPDHE